MSGNAPAASTPASGSSAPANPTPSTGSSTPSQSTSSAPASAPPSAGGTAGDAPKGPSSGAGADTSYDFMDGIFNDDSAPGALSGTPAEPGTAPGTTPTPKPAEPAQATPPVEAAASVQAQPQTPATEQPGTTPAQPAPQAASRPQLDPADPIGIAQALSDPANQASVIDHLASTVFKLEQKDLEALETDVAGTVPKLLARAVVFAQQQFLTQMGRIIPLMMERQQQTTQTHESNLGKFYSAWPGLDRSKHHDKVAELGARYRQLFPDTTLDQMIQQLGPMVMAAVGVPVTAQAAQAQVQPPVAPGAPPSKPQGFAPANPGTVVQQQQVQDNPFGFMEAG